jgi:1,2-diacylglycerol 3-beta-galactosyltransferase
MTDMVDIPPHFWMENQDQFLICGTQEAYRQAQETGFYSPHKVFSVSGMILKKAFYLPSGQAALTHRALGLTPDLPTLLISFGGNGSVVSQKIVQQIEKAKLNIQTIVLCGHNLELLESLKGKKNCHAVGFVSNVPDYLCLADILIGKPGPGSISEAIHMGCPVIIECNASTLPQERPNVEWVLENGLGISLKSFKRGVARPIRNMIADIERFRRNIKNNVPENRAVYEIASILDHIAKTTAKRSLKSPKG